MNVALEPTRVMLGGFLFAGSLHFMPKPLPKGGDGLKKTLVALLLLAIILAGCSGGGSAPNTPTGIERGVKAFEIATNIVNPSGEYDISWAKENVLKRSYNEPNNPFWTITMWYQTERYIFKDWVVSANGNQADIILTYSSIDSVSKTERTSSTKTFTMQNFGGEWRVNLAEFLGLD